MRKMYKLLLVTVIVIGFSFSSFAQQNYWAAHNAANVITNKDKAVSRSAYPKVYRLFDLDLAPLRQELFKVTDNRVKHTTVISLPNADGQIEEFEVVEASNFDPALQAQFPEIRAFSGRGVTDKYATLKLSISPQGIQTMVFRTDKENEFIEPYSQDHTVYSVFKSQRVAGRLPWTCSTVDTKLATGLNEKVGQINSPQSSDGTLRTMRLAQSVTAEYSNYFGAFNASQLNLVLTAINNTMTRCNGCYEKDLAVHLNLIPNESLIIYYDPNTDPYSPAGTGAGGAWNGELQNNLTATIGEANYDIGHLFGASGGGGNAGCIGCVCVNGQKGSGFTSPADGIPMGDNFDIDYVVHEVGHQMGANHTFSFSNEGTGQQKGVGADITIMGYAGITSYDPAPHSIDIYHETSIQQIQVNLAAKACPVATNISANNATPVVAPVNNYTIPKSTPFALTGSATDANPGDVLTYCWEQNDNHGGQTGANSVAYVAKPVGPNWLSLPATTSPTRLMPRLSTILAGLFVTPPFPGGDAICNIEALSSVGRTLNFRLTVRDNHPYSSTTPIAVGQTAYTDMVVTVDGTTGPFQVTAPNTNVTWAEGSSQTVTWSVNGTTGAPINCANVKITLSTDGGTTFPYVLAASTPNDGTELITIPGGTATTTARIKVEAIGNIFFDIDDANFTITASCVPPSITTQPANVSTCVGNNSSYTVVAGGSPTLTYQWQVSTTGCGGAFNNISNGGVYTGATTATLNITGATAGMNGYAYRCVVSGCAAPNATTNCATLTVNAATSITTQPANSTVCAPTATSFTVAASGTSLTYQWQVSTDGGTTWNNLTNTSPYTNVTTATLNISPTAAGLNGYQYRCVVGSACSPLNSNAATLTVNSAPAISGQPSNTTVCAGNTATFTVTATGGGLTYQWQESTNGGGSWTSLTNVAPYGGVTTATLSISPATVGMSGYQYRCIVSGSCPSPATSNAATLTVGTALVITTQPSNSTICAGANASFNVAASGTVNVYQWQESTNGGGSWNNITNGGIYGGATTATLTLTGVPATYNTYQYRCVLTGACPPINSNAGILTVNTLPAITSQPSASTICNAQNTSFSITATGTGITYQWQLSTTGCAGAFSNVVNGGVYSGATSATLTITGGTAAMNGYAYKCVVSGTCAPAATSNCVVLTVNTPISISTQPANSTVCAGSNASFSVVAAGTAPTYQWQESTNGGTSWNNISNGGIYGGSTTATLALTGVTAGMNSYQYRCVVTGSAPCGSVNTGAATLTVNTAPAITTNPVAGATLCAGQNTTFSVTATGTALTYQWQVSTDGGTTYNNIANGGVYSNVTTATLTISGATAAMNTYKYRCVVSGTCAPAATSGFAALTVYTPISFTTQPAASIMCATGTTSFTVVAAGTGPTYQWQESTNGGTTWNNISNGGIYSGATTATLTLTNLIPAMNAYQYRCVVTGTAPCGAVNTANALLTVSPQPVVTLSASPYTKLYPGYSTVITATVNPPLPFTAVWTLNGNAVTPTGNTYTVNVNKLGTYTVVATIGSCVSLPASITISDSASDKLWIFPSPNNGQFTISYYNPGGAPTTQMVNIYDAMGRRVYSNVVAVTQAYQLIQVDMTRNSAGVYRVVMRDASGKRVKTGTVEIR